MAVTTTLGDKIRELRRNKRYSLKEVADITGIDYTYLSKVENDRHIPSIDTVARLADILGGSLSELLDLSKQLPAEILRKMVVEQNREYSARLTRSTGAQATEEEISEEMVGNLPAQLVTAMATFFGLSEDNISELAKVIHALSGLAEGKREKVIQGITSLMEGLTE